MPVVKNLHPHQNRTRGCHIYIDKVTMDLLGWDATKQVTLKIVGAALQIEQKKESKRVPRTASGRKKKDERSREGRPLREPALCPVCSKEFLDITNVDGTKMYHCRNCDNGKLIGKLKELGVLI